MRQPAAITESLRPEALNMMRRWVSMWDRCYNQKSQAYEYYGARGIKVCAEWLNFQTFLDFWGHPPFEGATIGRIDNDGNYEPSNCEWQTQEQQNNNTRRSRLITWNGKTQSIRDWAKEYNIGERGLSERLRRGWDMHKSLTTPGRIGFAEELEDRRRRNVESWQRNGHLYAARSRYRRGHSLTLRTQELLAVEGVEETVIDQQKKSQSKGSRLAEDQKQRIFDLSDAGVSLRKISAFMGIPKSTVHYALSTRDALSC